MLFTFPWKPYLRQGQTAACLNPVTRCCRSQHKAACHSSMPSSRIKTVARHKWKTISKQVQGQKMNKRCESLFINLQRGECVRQIRPRDTRIKALSCSNWVQFQPIFFCAMKKYDLGRWEEQLPSGYWPIHKIKPLQLSSLCICVIYYLNCSCFAQVRMLCITLVIHICTEPW